MKSRITRMTAALLAAVLSLSLLVGCKPKKELTRYTTIFYDVFDTVTQVIAYCESEEEFNTQMQALHQDLIAYNQLYDIYNDYDGVVNVKTINENAGKPPVQVDARILSMLELARQMFYLRRIADRKSHVLADRRQDQHCHGQCAGHLARLPRSCRTERL
mgnify:CR=1 FL=1